MTNLKDQDLLPYTKLELKNKVIYKTYNYQHFQQFEFLQYRPNIIYFSFNLGAFIFKFRNIRKIQKTSIDNKRNPFKLSFSWIN